MKKFKSKLIMRNLIAVTVSSILIYSASGHVVNPFKFLDTIFAYNLVGLNLGVWIATSLPHLQAIVAVCLLLSLFSRSAFLVGSLLFAIFFVAQCTVLSRAMEIDCGCFGLSFERPVGTASLSIAAAGLSLCLMGFLLDSQVAKNNGRIRYPSV